MKIKVNTSYKPGTWDKYSGRGIKAITENWPNEIDFFVYHEESIPNNNLKRITWIDLHKAQPELVEFKNKYKNDPVACGETTTIPGGVRRLPNAGNMDRGKGSYLWDAVRFANKSFCVIDAVKNSKEYDYVVWIDADTYTFRPMPFNFLEQLLPRNTTVTFLGRENPNLNDGGRYPECGFVGYNLKAPFLRQFIQDWRLLYVTSSIFKLLEWHDSFLFWHLVKIYQKEK